MFSALKKLTRTSDDRCQAPVPMALSLQKKFSRGVHFNMKILIKGDRNVGKSCLLQRLQGGPFIEEYVPTDQIQVAPIHWTYKNSDHIVKVEVWEVVDKGRAKKKPPLGLKLENQSANSAEDSPDIPVLDATFLDVYKNANGVILMLDITKPWTFEYVVKELSQIPADLPVVILGNHCDMQHHRQIHAHHIDQAMHEAKLNRTAPVRYAESSMRNGFGLRLLHKFLSVPFLRLQKISLLEQLQRNQKDIEETEKDLDEFQSSDDSNYNFFLDRLTNKRRQTCEQETQATERSPSIVLGAGKPIIPPNVNPLLAHSLNPKGIKAQQSLINHTRATEDLECKINQQVSTDMTPHRPTKSNSGPVTPAASITNANAGSLDEFYAGTLDSSFLEDLTPMSQNDAENANDTESDEDTNPKVIVDEDYIDIEQAQSTDVTYSSIIKPCSDHHKKPYEDVEVENYFRTISINSDMHKIDSDLSSMSIINSEHNESQNEFHMWTADSSARRSPEGGEDPDSLVAKEEVAKVEKKHKKKKSKDKDKNDLSDKEKKDKKHKKKTKREKQTCHPQQDLLAGANVVVDYDDYDSI